MSLLDSLMCPDDLAGADEPCCAATKDVDTARFLFGTGPRPPVLRVRCVRRPHGDDDHVAPLPGCEAWITWDRSWVP